MNEHSFDKRARAWLALGPTQAPPDAVQEVFARIASVRQDPTPLRVGGRSLPGTRRALLAAAVAGVAVAGIAIALLRAPGENVASRPPGHLLFDYPETTTVLERSGGPTAAAARVEAGRMRGYAGYVVGASCAGGGEVTITGWLADVVPGVDEAGKPVELDPAFTHAVPCNGTAVHLPAQGQLSAPLSGGVDIDLVLDVPAGATWTVAAGGYRASVIQQNFPGVQLTEGRAVVMEASFGVLGHPGPGIAVQVPVGSSGVAVLVNCAGHAVTITADGHEPTVVPCDDPLRQTRVDLDATIPAFDVRAGSDRFAWVRLVAEAGAGTPAARPTAPLLPDGIADIGFAEADGQAVAFGQLGSNEQTVVPLPGVGQAVAGGRHVALALPADGGLRLELWSIADASSIRVLAEVGPGRAIYQTWVDETHETVYYGVAMEPNNGEWRRVGFDGSGDQLVASQENVQGNSAVLAIDDSAFVTDWCDQDGMCRRSVTDTASGESREIVLADAQSCGLVGAVDGIVVGRMAADCMRDSGALTATTLDGDDPRPLLDAFGDGTIVHTSNGPVLLAATTRGDTRTTLQVVDLTGGAPREIAAVEHEMGLAPRPSGVRIPGTDWALLAGNLGDTIGNQSIGRPVPRLVNVVTGEIIELPNLPHTQ